MTNEVVIAIDVGGTGMKCALVDPSKKVLHTERHSTGRERGPQAIVETIIGVAKGLAQTASDNGWAVRSAGVVVPGIVDEVHGIAAYAANLGFRDVPLRSLVADHLNLPTALGHDVRAGGLAEARLGAGRGREQVLVMPIGTGIAAAHVVRGTVASGAHGAAGELGHIVVRPDGPLCGCGLRGCLEAIASAASVERRYASQSGGAKTAAEIAGSLATDPIASLIWQETVDALVDGLLTGQALFDVELIIIGGGLAESGEVLLTPIREGIAKKATFHRIPEISKAELGDEAGCLGAALLALELS